MFISRVELKDKNSVPKEWLRFFQGMELTNSTTAKERGVIDKKVGLQRIIDFSRFHFCVILVFFIIHI